MAEPIISRDQLKASADEDLFVEGIVTVTLQEVIEEDHCGFANLLAERLIGEDIQEKLSNLTYKIVSSVSDALSIKVRGSIHLWVRDEEKLISEKEESD